MEIALKGNCALFFFFFKPEITLVRCVRTLERQQRTRA